MMKRSVSLLLVFLAISLYSCATYKLATTNKWLEYELPPSKIVKNGEVFFEGKLFGGSKFSIFYDEKIDNDASFYYTMLMQDFGWSLKNDNAWTAPQGSRDKKYGHIYVNTNRLVAIYFYPERTYSAFKVKIND